MPPGKVGADVMDSGGATATANFCVALTAELSVACTVKLELPEADGFPLKVPLAGSRLTPDGGEPADTDQTKGAVPPANPKTWE